MVTTPTTPLTDRPDDWYPVSDLPPIDCPVIATDGVVVRVSSVVPSVKHGATEWRDLTLLRRWHPTHWMHIPTLPNGFDIRSTMTGTSA